VHPEIQKASGKLKRRGTGDPYVLARTRLADAQRERIEQIHRTAERELIETAEAQRVLVDLAQAVRERGLSIPGRVQAAHPGIEPAILETVKKELEDLLRLAGRDVLARGEG
jgi:phage terminase Nu1 subunit (DNA packaging protein)